MRWKSKIQIVLTVQEVLRVARELEQFLNQCMVVQQVRTACGSGGLSSKF